MLALKNVNGGKEESVHTFLAGLFGGYWVFGHGRSANSSVNQQIVIYVFARVVLATAKFAVQPPGDNSLVAGSYGGRGGKGLLGLSEQQLEAVRRNSWPVFASLSWASVMWLFRYYPETLQPSLRSSMTYMYVPGFVVLLLFLSFSVSFTDLGLTRHFPCVDTQTRKNGMVRGTFFGTTSESRCSCIARRSWRSILYILLYLGLGRAMQRTILTCWQPLTTAFQFRELGTLE